MSKCPNLQSFIMRLFVFSDWNRRSQISFYKTEIVDCTGSCTIRRFDSVSPKAKSKSNLLLFEYYASFMIKEDVCSYIFFFKREIHFSILSLLLFLVLFPLSLLWLRIAVLVCLTFEISSVDQ